MPDRPHRAPAVRSLSLVIKRAATIVHLFKNAFPKLVNLLVLTLVSDTVQLFDPLLTTPPHVLSLVVGGANCPPRIQDILSAQSQVKGLCIEFSAGEAQIPPFADKDLLPNIRVLRLSAHIFPPTLFTYAYPLTSLTLMNPSHEDMSYALQLFGETLLVFAILKEVTPHCSPRCFWPTCVLRGVRLRKLRYLEVQQQWSWDLQHDMGDFDYPVVEAMTDPGLKEACPMLQTIVWGTESLVTESLYESVLGNGPAPIHEYARMLFDVFPRLDRLAVYDRIDVDDDSRRRKLGDIWTRANKDSDDADYGLVDTRGWMDEAVELHRLIVDELVLADPDALLSWWASLATICKTLFPHVEAQLYYGAEFETCELEDAKIYLRSVAMPDRPHRAPAVRSLSLDIKSAATIVHLFKNASPKLVNLNELTLISDTVELFDTLLTTPPRVLSLTLGGANYPPHFRDILSAQSRVRWLRITLPAGDKQIPLFTDKDLLPNTQVLHLSANIFSPALFTYAYPLTSLTLLKPSHEDISHALRLFSETLLVLVISKEATPRCSPRCFWPTWVFRGARLQRLRYLEIQLVWSSDLERDMGDFDYPVVEAMTDPGLEEACPTLQTIIWGTEYLVTESLYIGPFGLRGPSPIQEYVQMLFDTFPHFERLAVYDKVDLGNDSGTRFLGDVWTRTNKDSGDPDFGDVHTSGWLDEALGE
ncbi:hypothetical protein ACG7TL_001783 [Trametes sanguinea]